MSENIWKIRNVPIETQRRIKAYASAQGKTIGKVLEELAEKL